MGKKAKLKKIRRLASQMPVINVPRVIGERVGGHTVLVSGVKEVDGQPVSAMKDYVRKNVIETPLNHNRQMKKLYNKHGVRGVNTYINAVVQHVQKQKAKENESAGS
jgi:hypothetical protein